tara:strand:+ start:437 stop:850 length:414 start_codon:yes stop_codon:yes gene_type:complete
MIKYSLICEDCENIFDSWFGSSKEFDKLKKLKLVNCNSCNSLKVKKSLMSPQILKKQYKNDKKIKIFKNKMKEYQKFIKKNFKYVGENFTYEARSLHYDPKKKSKGIYGKATDQEIKSLSEEGIEIQSIPWLNEKDN